MKQQMEAEPLSSLAQDHSESATFVVTFTTTPGVDGVSTLRGTLKLALRHFGLRATEIREHINQQRSHCDD
jgi:hypothetical protein